MVIQSMTIARPKGFITAATSAAVALAALITLGNLGHTRLAESTLLALSQRDFLRAELVQLDARILSGQTGDLGGGISILEIPAQAAFNLAGLYDRLGPEMPLFVDKGQTSILGRLLARCLKTEVKIDRLMAWVAERSTKREFIPVDGLIHDRIVDGVSPDLLWACLRLDPPIYRTRLLEAPLHVLGAWFDLPSDVLASFKKHELLLQYRDSSTLKSSVVANIKLLGGDLAEINELGFSLTPRLRRYVILDGDKVFATLLITSNNKGQHKIVSRRIFWSSSAVGKVVE